MEKFVHLHLHTEWNLLDEIIRIDELFSKAQEFGYKAVAITDHGGTCQYKYLPLLSSHSENIHHFSFLLPPIYYENSLLCS